MTPDSPQTAALDVAPREDELAAHRRAKRRIALTTFSVAFLLSAGGAVAAASEQGIRDSFAQPAVPPSNGPVAPGTAGSQPTSPRKPGEVPASATLPGAVPEHVVKGLGKAADVPVPPQVPVPGSLPAVPLP